MSTPAALAGPKSYVMSQSLRGSTEPAVVWNRLTADLFGAAGPSMRKYFGVLERMWTQWDYVEGPERKLYGWGNQFMSAPASLALFRSARAALDRGLAADPDPAVQARIALWHRFVDETKQYLETQPVPDKRTLFRRSDDALRADVAGGAGCRDAGQARSVTSQPSMPEMWPAQQKRLRHVLHPGVAIYDTKWAERAPSRTTKTSWTATPRRRGTTPKPGALAVKKVLTLRKPHPFTGSARPLARHVDARVGERSPAHLRRGSSLRRNRRRRKDGGHVAHGHACSDLRDSVH